MGVAESVIERMERTVEGAVAAALDVANRMAAQFGERPLFWGEGDDLDKLERYLDVRDNDGAWRVLLDEEIAQYGRDAAEMRMATEAIAMEALLDHNGGAEAVRAALLLRRIRSAKPALRQIERIDSLPDYEIRDALPAYDEMAVLGALAEGQAMDFEPRIQTPADVLAPPRMMDGNGG